MLSMYSIFDSRSGIYNSPFVAFSDGDASRAVIRQARNPESQIAQFPEDYVLYRIGSFDERTGLLTQVTPETVARISTLVAIPESQKA